MRGRVGIARSRFAGCQNSHLVLFTPRTQTNFHCERLNLTFEVDKETNERSFFGTLPSASTTKNIDTNGKTGYYLVRSNRAKCFYYNNKKKKQSWVNDMLTQYNSIQFILHVFSQKIVDYQNHIYIRRSSTSSSYLWQTVQRPLWLWLWLVDLPPLSVFTLQTISAHIGAGPQLSTAS